MKRVLCFILFILIIFSCAKKNKQLNTQFSSSNTVDKEKKVDYSEDDNFEGDPLLSPLPEDRLRMIIDNFKDSPAFKEKKVNEPKYSINKSYLNDSLKFNSLDSQNWLDKTIGVIGTAGVKLYNNIEGSELSAVPKGEIIEILEEFKKPGTQDEEFGDLYKFNDEYNYWYKIKYQNKTGFVFGSYIVRDVSYNEYASENPINIVSSQGWRTNRINQDSINEKLLRISYFYKKDVKFDKFYDFNGTVGIPEKVKSILIKDKFALAKIDYKEYEYNLDFECPDDMIALYNMLHSDRMATTFITTDFLIHNLHLLFDKMLENTEARIMYPLVKILTAEYYNKLSEYEKNTTADEKVLKDTIVMMKKYFLVAGHVLGLKLTDESEYPEDVKKELMLIEKAEGFEKEAPIFKYKEDYSQFKPRGHYTKNKNLQKYFKAMMWFGRLHFYCDQRKDNIKYSLKLTPSALLLLKIAKDNPGLYDLWRAIFNPITYIVGESDDYNMDQYFAISDDVDFNNFGKWLGNEKNILKFIDKADKELKKAKIFSGTNLKIKMKDVEDPSEAPPQGFRLFGQRFTFDSFIHHMLSSTRVGDIAHPRNMVKGLDIMGVFGNKLADKLLADDKTIFKNYKENYSFLQNEINKFDTNTWRITFYNSYLKIIKEAAIFDNTMPFYFTQSENWDKKALLTSHAAWSELRHDTILYVKQSYGELAGKGPEMTWVVDKIKRPVGYVEPNLGVLYWIQSILEDSVYMLVENGFMTEAYKNKFIEYKDIIDKLVNIAEMEAHDSPITDEQNEFIYSIPYILAKIILPETSPSGTPMLERKDYQMAIIADVHTDGVEQMVLEVGTGIPYRIYVALNDGNGGMRIAEGYVYSYYEFIHPMNDRLNDDQWKEKVYSDNKTFLNEVDMKVPGWIKDIIIY